MLRDEIDCRLIARVCGDIGDVLYPFQALAGELGISEDELLSRLQSYRESGSMRRFGAMLQHRRAGYAANGMSVWNVPDAQVPAAGRVMTGHPAISHCYARPRLPDWPYNLYAMIHAPSTARCEAIAAGIARDTGVQDYRILYSLREFKKTSMVYLAEGVEPPQNG